MSDKVVDTLDDIKRYGKRFEKQTAIDSRYVPPPTQTKLQFNSTVISGCPDLSAHFPLELGQACPRDSHIAHHAPPAVYYLPLYFDKPAVVVQARSRCARSPARASAGMRIHVEEHFLPLPTRTLRHAHRSGSRYLVAPPTLRVNYTGFPTTTLSLSFLFSTPFFHLPFCHRACLLPYLTLRDGIQVINSDTLSLPARPKQAVS